MKKDWGRAEDLCVALSMKTVSSWSVKYLKIHLQMEWVDLSSVTVA